MKREKLNGFRKAIKELRQYARERINERILKIKNQEYIPKDILSNVINNSKEESIDIESLIDDFLTLFLAGQETTANTLAFVFLELGRNPDAFKKTQEEIQEVIGNKPFIDLNDINKLEYTSCVLKETMRLWPALAEFSRQSPEDLEINGFKIPKDTWFQLVPFASSRSPKYFKDPEKFIPERFLQGHQESNDSIINSYTYFPFSLGPRNCIGQNFAKIQAKILIAKFFQNFNYKLDKNQSDKVIEYITLRPVDGCRVFLTHRSSI